MGQKHLTEAEISDTLAENLVYLRKTRSRRISQKALARILSLPPKTIMNYENSRTVPLAYAVLRIADYYGLTVEELQTKHLEERKRNFETQ